MNPWRLSLAATRLRAEINALYPKRDKASDGAVGDTSHQARVSDHNPDKNGWVRAIDIDEDLLGSAKPDPMNADALVAQLVAIAKRDGRMTYIIFEGRIWSVTSKWKPVKYSGSNPHNHHIHISFAKSADLDPRPFGLRKV